MVDVSTEIEPNLFDATWKTFNEAVDAGIGKVDFGDPDFDFVNELKYNNAVFSAFKTHRQQNDLVKLLTDQDGNLKSFAQFKKDTETVIGAYNRDWLATEYNTAVLRARQAGNFKKYERDADLYPNLKWMPSTSVEKREGHIAFYGLVKPINDPFWQQHYPGNLWNCKCGITNTDEGTDQRTPKADYDPAPGLDENPAFSGAIFSKSNTYKTNAYKGADSAVASSLAKIPNPKNLKKLKKEFESFGTDYVKEGFDAKTGGYWVTHKHHQKGKDFHFEREASEILYKKGYRVVLGDERGDKFNVKYPEGTLNEITFDIKTVLGTGKSNIYRHLSAARQKKVKHIVLYYPQQELFSSDRLNRGFSKFRGRYKYKFEKVWYIVDENIHIYK